LGFKKHRERGREERGKGWQKSCFTLTQREGKRWNENPQETQRERKKVGLKPPRTGEGGGQKGDKEMD
jgi:hypothetical protein